MSQVATTFRALEQHLRAFAEPRGLDVARSGYEFAPRDRQTYLRASILVNRNERLGIGSTDPHRSPGIFQIDVVGPVNVGVAGYLTLADEIVGHFATDTILIGSVRITERPSVASPQIDAAEVGIPVSVPYETLT
jgi:hypothetical protein